MYGFSTIVPSNIKHTSSTLYALTNFLTFFQSVLSSNVSDDKDRVILSWLTSPSNIEDNPIAVVCPLLYSR